MIVVSYRIKQSFRKIIEVGAIRESPLQNQLLYSYFKLVSDTSPLCYLLLIGKIELFPQLYSQVLIPKIFQQELSNIQSPCLTNLYLS